MFETVLMGTNTQIETLRNPGADEREIAAEMLELLNIGHLAERGYTEVSGGERQLGLIARALAQKSRNPVHSTRNALCCTPTRCLF